MMIVNSIAQIYRDLLSRMKINVIEGRRLYTKFLSGRWFVARNQNCTRILKWKEILLD